LLVWFWHLHSVISVFIGFGQLSGYLKKAAKLGCWRISIKLVAVCHLSGRISATHKKRPENRPLFYPGDMPPLHLLRLGDISPDVPLTEGSFC
jgi:hypothetical protein